VLKGKTLEEAFIGEKLDVSCAKGEESMNLQLEVLVYRI
jgi:hypothetical protein